MSPIRHFRRILPSGRVPVALKPKMVVEVEARRFDGIPKCLISFRGTMLSADPGSTWIRSTFAEPTYPVKYSGRSWDVFLMSMSSGVKVMQGICLSETWQQVVQPCSISVSFEKWVENASASANASCRASRVGLDNRRRSYTVIRAGMLFNCASTLNR